MTNKLKQRESYPSLAINSTNDSFGFGYRKKNNHESDELFIKKFDNDHCNKLIYDKYTQSRRKLLYTSDS